VQDTPEDTIPEDDHLGDLNPPTVSYHYGPDEEPENPPPIVIHEEPEFPQPIVETAEQAPETDITPIPLLGNQDLYPQVEAPDARATLLRRSHRTVKKPQRLVPTFGSKTYQSTAAVTTHLVHPDAHLDSNYVIVAHYILVQFSMKAGLKRFKERGEEGVTKELSQLHFRDTFEPINPKDLNEEERLQVLESHLFLKEKRDTTVKGQMVAGGNKQHGTMDKQDASFPTAALELVLLTAVIGAKEGCDVAVIDIPNAFVQTRLENKEDKAVMRLRGKLAEQSVAQNLHQVCYYQPHWRDCAIRPPAQRPLWHHESCSTLLPTLCYQFAVPIGFKINPYDPCVANKNVKGKELTVVWHVDGLKNSHRKPSLLTRMTEWLKGTYKRLFDDGSVGMTISRGKIHDSLGMSLDFTVPREVKITMIDYVKDMLLLFSDHDKSDSTAKAPAAEHLFRVNDASTSLTQEAATIFHNFVAKCLFLTKKKDPTSLLLLYFSLHALKDQTKTTGRSLCKCFATHVEQLNCHLFYAQTLSPSPSGGLMAPMLHTPTCAATLVAVCPLETVCLFTLLPPKVNQDRTCCCR
jgi:hypothetical protein